MTDEVVQTRILEDLYKILKSGLINVKGGMQDILKLLENAKKEKTALTELDLAEKQKLWDKIFGICHSRNRNDYTAAGLRNFFSRSNFFGSGRDPMAALIYQAIDDIRKNETESKNRIKNLAGLLNTHQKRRAYIRLKKEIIIKEAPNEPTVLSSDDAALLDTINKSLSNPNQPLYNIMRNEKDINIYICADPPKGKNEFPKKKSIIISRIRNDYYAYTIQKSIKKEIVVAKKLNHDEVTEQLKMKHFELELKKLKKDQKNSNMTNYVYIDSSEEDCQKYYHILKKFHPDIHYDNPVKCSVTAILSQNFVFQQVAFYAERLYKILNHCNIAKKANHPTQDNSEKTNQSPNSFKKR